MYAHIDWLSFVFPLPDASGVKWGEWRSVVYAAAAAFFQDDWHILAGDGAWSLEGGRAPFNLSIMRPDGGMRVFWTSSLPYCLAELTGTGCRAYAEAADLWRLTASYFDSLSRLDLAVDWLTDVQPGEFASQRDVARFKAYGILESQTGSTYYVGSLKSDRFARVYRYAPPHPRSDTLRCEMVFRRDSAKKAAEYIGQHSPEGFVEASRRIYGWTHPLFSQRAETLPLAGRDLAKPEAKRTTSWIFSQVVPAIARELDAGRFTYQELLQAIEAARLTPKQTNFLPEEK